MSVSVLKMLKSLPVFGRGVTTQTLLLYFSSLLAARMIVFFFFFNLILPSLCRTDDIVKRLLSLELASHVCVTKWTPYQHLFLFQLCVNMCVIAGQSDL